MAEIRRRTFVTAAAGAIGMTSLGWSSSPAQAAPGRGIELAGPGRPSVVLRWWGGETAKFAAEELRDYVARITGISLAVRAAALTTGTAPHDAQHGVIASRGTSDTIPSAWLAPAATALESAAGDAFVVLAQGDRVVLAGRRARASLYAVYEVLEQLGVRFFAPQFGFYEGHSEYVPRDSAVVVSEQTLMRQPTWDLRRRYVEEGFSHTAQNLPQMIDWMAKQRLNTLVYPFDYIALGTTVYDEMRTAIIPALRKRDVTIEVGGHGYDSFLKPAEYPQYYTRSKVLFDVDNDAALEAYVNKVVEYLSARPEIGIFDCWAPDMWTFPKAILDHFGGKSTNVEAHVANTLSRALAERLPTVRVERIAYASTIDPPSPEYATDPTVIVDFAPINRNYKGSLDNATYPANARFAGQLQDWRSNFDGDLAMYEYYRRYRWRSAPAHPLATIAGDVKFEATVPVQGMGMYSEPADWVTYELVQLLVARLSWDTTLDADGYVGSYLQDRFGEAARHVHDYYRSTSSDPDAYSGSAGVMQGLSDYQQARLALERATDATAGAGARHVIERLRWNLDVAIADLELSHATLVDPAREAERKARLRELFTLHRFDGVALWCNYAARRWMPMSNTFRRVVADAYRSPAYGFTDEAVKVVAGQAANVVVSVQDVDYSGHDVDWAAELPEVLSVTPARGMLSVQGSGVSSQTVTVTVPEDTPAGIYPIIVKFVTGAGIWLPDARIDVTVTR